MFLPEPVTRQRLVVGLCLSLALISPALGSSSDRIRTALVPVGRMDRSDGPGVLVPAQEPLGSVPPLPTLTPAPPPPQSLEPAPEDPPTVNTEAPPAGSKSDAQPPRVQSGLVTTLPAPGPVEMDSALTNPAPLKAIDQSMLAAIKVPNPADLSVEILPATEVAVGTKVSFRVGTKRSGYLILVDVDANGRITQIYPNTRTLMNAEQQNANLVKPERPFVVPRPNDPFAGLQFVASPPSGQGMIVALLSDRPVQLVDLPDLSEGVSGQAAALARLTKMVGELLIPDGETGRLQSARWSFKAKVYSVR
jgi:hypothetical protein